MKKIIFTLIAFFVASGITFGQSDKREAQRQSQLPTDRSAMMTQVPLINEVRHEVLMVPSYGVFDWIEFQVSGEGTVRLNGQVAQPTTKSNAAARVGKIPGVTQVNNQIHVLPLSPMDDQLRRRVYRAVYNFDSPLYRYSIQAVPPIHIIVDGGKVTLKGIVANKSDSNFANIAANGVTDVFKVMNELQIEPAVR